ncbi:MAG: V-type ATP synthase subunit F [Candidatus Micrarchaeia archaeon]
MPHDVSQIAVLGDSSLITGFKLSGVQKLYPASSSTEENEKLLSQLMADDSIGLIIVGEELLEGIDWRLKRKVEDAAKPVVVSVPSRQGPMEQGESLAKLIKRALGFDIMGKEKKK